MIVTLGPPGAGKSTQGRLLSERLGVPYVSSGDLARASAPDIVARGGLLPDDKIAQLVFARLAQPDAQEGAILDGFPRTLNQVRQLDDWLRQHNAEPPTVLYLDVPADELRARLGNRQVVAHRADDRPDAVATRLALFEEQMPPILDAYAGRGQLRRIDASGPVDDVQERIMRALT